MLEIRNKKPLQSKMKICKSDVKIGDCAYILVKPLQLTRRIQPAILYTPPPRPRKKIPAAVNKKGRIAAEKIKETV